MRRPTEFRFLRLAMLLALILPARLEARPKLDVLVMKNGDRITCEIRGLQKGQLMIRTSYTIGTIPVDWQKVARIESPQYFRVRMASGAFHTGLIELLSEEKKSEKNDFRIRRGTESEEVPQRDIVVIEQLEKTWKQNISGSIDAGLSFTKNNDTTDLTLNSSLSYKAAKRVTKVSYSTTIKRQKDAGDTNRNNLSGTFLNELKGQYFSGMLVDLLQSDEQQLALRTTVGGGVGRYFVHSNRMTLNALGGMVFANERFTDTAQRENERQQNAEGLITVNFEMYRFDSTRITAQTRIFPSFTSAGRVRLDNNLSFRLDLWGDLYWSFSLWHNFDSKPPVSVPQNDYGVNSTVGWSF